MGDNGKESKTRVTEQQIDRAKPGETDKILHKLKLTVFQLYASSSSFYVVLV